MGRDVPFAVVRGRRGRRIARPTRGGMPRGRVGPGRPVHPPPSGLAGVRSRPRPGRGVRPDLLRRLRPGQPTRTLAARTLRRGLPPVVGRWHPRDLLRQGGRAPCPRRRWIPGRAPVWAARQARDAPGHPSLLGRHGAEAVQRAGVLLPARPAPTRWRASRPREPGPAQRRIPRRTGLHEAARGRA